MTTYRLFLKRTVVEWASVDIDAMDPDAAEHQLDRMTGSQIEDLEWERKSFDMPEIRHISTIGKVEAA